MATAGPIRVELGALLRLAGPMVAVQIGTMLMGTVDTVMVGHSSTRGLAAVSLGNVYHFGLLVLGQGILMSLDPLIAQSHGAEDRDAVSLWFRRGVVLALALTVPFTLAFQLAGPVLSLLGQPPDVVPIAAAWVRAVSLGVAPFLLFVAMRQTLQAMHIVRPVLVAVVVGNLANVVGDWALIYGHLGLPAMGAVGSAWSTALCRWLMAAMLLVGTVPALADYHRPPLRALFELKPYRRMLEIGVPIGFQLGLELWMFLGVSLVMGWMGERVLDAHQIALTLASLTFMVPLGIGAAAAVRVGNAIGRGDPVATRRAALVAMGAGASVMTLSALCFALAPRLLARIFSDDREVIALAATLLPIAALFQIFDGTQAVGSGILRGAADTRMAAVINLLGYWVLGLPIGLVLAYPLHLGPRGLWWGLTAGLMVVALLLLLRVVRRIGVVGK